MSKVAVVYWSSTGNTEAMANAVADGIREKGGEAVLHTCEDFDGSKVKLMRAKAGAGLYFRKKLLL